MLRKNTLNIVFTFFALFFWGQRGKIDSLIKASKTLPDSEKAKVYNQIADLYKTVDPSEMQKYAVQAINISKKNNDQKEEIFGVLNLGVAKYIEGDFNAALKNLNLAEDEFENLDQEDREVIEGIAKAKFSKGVVLVSQNDYAKGINKYFQSLKIYETLQDSIKIAKVYNNIGVIYQSIEDEPKALYYYLKAYNIFKNYSDISYPTICGNIGKIYLDLNYLPKAKFFFDKSFLAFQRYDDSRGLGELYNNLAIYFSKINHKEYHLLSLCNAEKEFNKINNQFGLSDTYYYLGKYYLENRKYYLAIEQTTRGLKIAQEMDLIDSEVLAEKQLSEIYKEIHNIPYAYNHLKKYDEARMILLQEKNTKDRMRAEIEYNLEKEKIVLEEESKKEKQRWIFTSVIIGILSLIGIYIYKNNQSRKKILLEKELAQYEHKALHLQMNPHFIFNSLAAVSAYFVQNGKEDALKYLAKFSKLMRLTLEYSKESLIPIDKEIESLQNYLELEQLRFNQKFNFKIHKSQDIEDDTAIPSLLIQPYVENAILHGIVPQSVQGEINIDFFLENDTLVCRIKDNGIGIETSKENKKNLVIIHKSMALKISEKRLSMLERMTNKKTSVEIEEIKDQSNKVVGTLVTLRLPLQYIEK